jgi:F-type H+-transporting ATPase subunit a
MYKLNTILSPLDQFEIRNLFSINISFLGNNNFSLTNIGLYIIISLILIIIYSLLAINNNKIIPNN